MLRKRGRSKAISFVLSLSLVLSVFAFAPMSASADGPSDYVSYSSNTVTIDGDGLVPADVATHEQKTAILVSVAGDDLDSEPEVASSDIEHIVINNANQAALIIAGLFVWAQAQSKQTNTFFNAGTLSGGFEVNIAE